MHGDATLLSHLVVIILVALIVVYLLKFIKVPPLIGFLLSGTLLGPHGLSIIQNSQDINTIAEIGVILLLFSIGLEFPLNDFKRYFKLALFGGTAQIILTILLTCLFSNLLNLSVYKAIFLGGILSLSSTSIVIKLLSEKGMMATVSGRMSMAILIFQDIAVIPMLILLPIFGGEDFNPILLLNAVFKTGVFLAIIYLLNRFVMDQLFKEIVKTRNREVFVLMIVLTCFGVAFISHQFGLSLALGAFIAGVMLASSEYSYQMSAHILSFRGFFESIFFISIGLFLNPVFVQENIFEISMILSFIVIGKALICTLVFIFARYPLSLSITAGLLLSQIGEFSFVLASEGLKANLIGERTFQLTVSSALISMLLSPLLFRISHPAGKWMANLSFLAFLKKFYIDKDIQVQADPKNHIVIAGYGTVGSAIGKILKKHKTHTVVIDTYIYNVERAKKDGFETILGDASTPFLLEKAGIHNAQVIVITLPDPIATHHIIKTVRDINENIPLIVRANYKNEALLFKQLGGEKTYVTYTELEIIIDLLRNTLKTLGKTKEEIINDIETVIDKMGHMTNNELHP
ncbi:MAG: cation:proton antiporter [Deltaproteobacteria bacterium]|nr:cation:proton antiporter [Deltaproteobacteria bacterium]